MKWEKRSCRSVIKLAITGLLCVSLVACAGLPRLPGLSSGSSKRATVKTARNAPQPIPLPRWKPRINRSAVQAKARSASGGQVTVTRGDTLYALSRRYGIQVKNLILANNLRAPYQLAVGQKLKLPVARVHTVKRGETGYGISRRYGVTVSELMAFNNLRKPFRLEIGQKLRIPGTSSTPPQNRSTQIRQTRRVAQAAAPRSQSSGRVTALPTPPPRTGSRFQWPVRGQLASRFGPKEGGLHNDGINIIARAGEPVRASEAGVIVYASNALEGYGNLLLVKHAQGWVTAYAHNERLLVRRGQKVEKGQVIARVGATGGVEKPQLHFEIRKGRRALDPLRYLERASAQRANTGSSVSAR